MRLTGLAALGLAAAVTAAPAFAELNFPSLSYRTGPYASGGAPFADGYADYFTLLNERDGGIGGEKAVVTECETAYDTTRGVECYEQLREGKPLVLQPMSTGITYQLIPKMTADKLPLLTVGYGRTSAADGSTFPWVFNFPATYWDGASVAIKYLLDENGGSLEGKKIALLYHNSAYGKEPIRTLEKLSEKYGFALTTIPVDSPGQEQKSQWLQIRRERPDYVLMWGWGVMNSVAVSEAASIGFPMDHFIGIWWSGAEPDVLPAGAGANGYKALAFTGVGDHYKFYDDLRKYVVDAGKGAGDGSSVGTVQYNRGVFAAMLAAESARKAQALSGHAGITPEEMRDGMEALSLDAAALEALGMTGFSPEISVSCQNHRSKGKAMMTQWDAAAKKWVVLTDFIEPDDEVIWPLVEEDAAAFRSESGVSQRECPAG
ncbi:ABC transporter substrate-binding protein [Amaricoccus sp.]|uniref:ABC transporter substrate-binding protein n=1 Tax=Amaricoccus sp. TaxID=1872485 RepID=UPI001B5AF26A|nr:ABC transporter substrate-binding protein [Amaricoccus sp.]MBP7001238.1 ABC transporter substrate-binding protein [Amaricoccus sp.]